LNLGKSISKVHIFSNSERAIMASGTVKWFNGQKGYGFIQPDGGGIVHNREICRPSLTAVRGHVVFDLLTRAPAWAD
jgi:hypothetical protein